MDVRELERCQLEELKRQLFWVDSENEDFEISDGVAEKIHYPTDIPDSIIFDYYGGICFVEDDFFCTAGKA